MGRRLAIAAILLAALFGAAYVIYGLVFDNEPEAPPAADAAPVVAAAVDASAPPSLPPRTATVTSIEGSLEREDDQGKWHPVGVGDTVNVNDALRTVGDNSLAVLELNGGTTIDLAGEFTVPVLSSSLSTVQVVNGRVKANVVPDGDSRFRVEARGSDAAAETGDGEFSVLSTGTGDVAVASRRGKVALSSAGKSVDVKAGEQSVVRGGGPPSPPEKLPTELLLKVGKTARQLRVKQTLVRGTTTPGAIVSVGGVRVQADETGAFETRIALKEGRNRLSLVVEDVAGRTRIERLPPVVVDSRPPKVKSGLEW